MVERRARPHVPGDIGDGDPDDPAALVLRVVVRHRSHRVVVIAGIRRVDRDKRKVAQILAQGLGWQRGIRGLVQHLLGEGMRNAVLVDGDQRDLARLARVPEPLGHLSPA